MTRWNVFEKRVQGMSDSGTTSGQGKKVIKSNKSHNSIRLQGDHSACSKPPVDIDMKVTF